MAEVIRYVDPDASGTGTGLTWTNAYTSLSAWEAAEQTNLVTDGDWHHCYVRASSGSVDSTITTIDGWTTGANNYILIEAASGDEAQASGWSTSRYRLSLSNSDALVINEDYVRVVGLQIEVTSSNGTGQDCITITAPGGTTSDIKIQNCRLEGPGSGYAFVQRGIYAAAGTIDIVNTVIYDTAISASGAAGIWCNGATMTISNCVISKTSYGMYEPSGTITAKNCAVFDCVSDDWLSGPTTIDYCASDDGDGTNPVSPSGANWDNEYTAPSTGDFTPLGSGNVYHGGIAISGLTTDMDGETYNDPPTIGALEVTSSGVFLAPTITGTGTVAVTVSTGISLIPEIDGVGSVEAILTHKVSFIPEVDGISNVNVVLDTLQVINPIATGIGEMAVVLDHNIQLSPSTVGTANVNVSFEFDVALNLTVSGIGIVTYNTRGLVSITRSLFAGLFRKFLEKT